MSVTRAQIKMAIEIALATTPPFGGAATASANIDESWPEGTDSRQFDRMAIFAYAIPALATQILDLQTDLMENMVALGLTEVRLLQVFTLESNLGVITMEPDATDGWTALLQTGSKVNMAAGVNMPLVSPLSGKYAVSGTDKQLLFTNTDAVNVNQIAVIVAGIGA